MASPATSKLPPPKSWDEFEDMMVDLAVKEWGTPNVTRCGRLGQQQHGVDLYGYPNHLRGVAGVQCKNTSELTWEVVEAAIREASGFAPRLAEFTIATTAPSDSAIQRRVRLGKWPFPVHIRFWGDIALALARHNDLLERNFPGWIQKRSSSVEVRDLLLSSPPEDFRTVYVDRIMTQVCRKDVRLRIIHRDTGRDDFMEPWVGNFPANSPHLGKKPAIRQEVEVEFNGSPVLSQLWVLVDGARHLLPLPESQDNLVIDRFQFHLGRIVNIENRFATFEDAIARAGFNVVDRHRASDPDWLPHEPAPAAAPQAAVLIESGTETPASGLSPSARPSTLNGPGASKRRRKPVKAPKPKHRSKKQRK